MTLVKHNSGVELKKKKLQKQIMVIAGIIVIFVVCNIILGGRLLTFENIKVILIHATYPALVAWGLMFIFSGGLIDLSVGATIILAANMGVLVAEDFGMGYAGLIIATIVVAVICEFLSVTCSVGLKIPSWVSGLGMALIFEAICTIQATARSKTAGSSNVYLKNFRVLGEVPWIFIVVIIAFTCAYLLFNHSSVGLNIRAVGGSESVAEAMGINKKKAIFTSALVGAVFVGIAAITQVSYTGKFSAMSGLGSLSNIFKALATLLLGGSLSRIFSDPVGIGIAAVAVMSLFNVLTLLGVPSGAGQEMCLGAVVILCGALSNWRYKGMVK